ncbi:MAG: DUF4147 domain-containing protein [Magnetococcus sp. WYHC-3]
MSAALSPPPVSLLRMAFRAALGAVHGERLVSAHLSDVPLVGPHRLVALGKAATAMASGALATAGASITRALVIGKPGPCILPPALMQRDRVLFLTGDHPRPGVASLRAGATLLRFLDECPPEESLLFLLSGGGSSLVEAPSQGLSLEDLGRINDWLLASGMDIHSINPIRGCFSRIKAGRLIHRVAGHAVRQCLLSDVRGHDPALIASGPLCPGADALPQAQWPVWMAQLARDHPAPPRPGEACFQGVQTRVLAGVEQALAGAEAALRARGVTVFNYGARLRGDAARNGHDLGEWLRREALPGVHLWGGETTVTLPESPGRGGRARHLALAAALALDGLPAGECVLLSAGSDGDDGPEAGEDPVAGAWVDGTTAGRVRQGGWDPQAALAQADSARALAVAGAEIRTGCTGTNVADLVLAWKRG